MKRRLSEKEVLKVLRKYPYGINVRGIADTSEISRQTVIKILKNFEKEGLIHYPKVTRGKESKITLKKLTQKRLFQRIRKQERILENEFDEPIIIKDKYDQTYAGTLDDIENKGIFLHNTHLLDEHDEWEKLDGLEYLFEFEDVSEIYGIKLEELDFEHVTLDDVLKLWINPNHRIVKGIYCNWGGNITIHSKECDSQIHEALSTIMKIVWYESNISESEKKNAEIEFKKIIEHIILNGGKIPIGNH